MSWSLVWISRQSTGHFFLFHSVELLLSKAGCSKETAGGHVSNFTHDVWFTRHKKYYLVHENSYENGLGLRLKLQTKRIVGV